MSSGVEGGVLRGQVGRLARIALKELREVLRDRRTILTLLLMPMLVYPLLSIAFRQFMLASVPPEQAAAYTLAFETDEDEQLFLWYFRLGAEVMPLRRLPPDSVESARGHVISPPTLRYRVLEDPIGMVREGRMDLAIRLRDRDAWQKAQQGDIASGQPVTLECEIVYVYNSSYGERALDYLEKVIASANARLLHLRLRARSIAEPSRPDPIRVDYRPQQPPSAGDPFLLKTFIPLILILMTITGAVYPAIDLTAGERERGTLEMLIAAPVPRLGLLFAKYVAVVTVALLTALANLFMMTLTLSVPGLAPPGLGGELTVGLVIQVLVLLVLFAAFFSAVLLVLTSFARSFKEAQAYIVPLMLLTLAPGMASLMPSIKLEGLLTVTPLMNMVLLARDLFMKQADPTAAVFVVLSTLLYAAAALALAARIFGAEAVLYSEQSGWPELFRRPTEPQLSAGVVSALVCLAILFPVSFLLTHVIGSLSGPGLVFRLVMTVAVSVGVFAGIPVTAALLGRVRADSGFELRRPSLTAIGGALLLGVSLWLLVHEFALLLRDVGLTRLDPARRFEEEVHKALEQLRSISPVWVLLAYGMVPAVVEELFFRGYLFSALRHAGGARTAIVTSGLLFGLFHLIAPTPLPLERFVITTLLGLVLGWVCWRSGSVLPGMLLHAGHNSALLLAALFSKELNGVGWNTEQDHLPLLWLIPGLIATAAGAVLVSMSRPVGMASGGRQPPEGVLPERGPSSGG